MLSKKKKTTKLASALFPVLEKISQPLLFFREDNSGSVKIQTVESMKKKIPKTAPCSSMPFPVMTNLFIPTLWMSPETVPAMPRKLPDERVSQSRRSSGRRQTELTHCTYKLPQGTPIIGRNSRYDPRPSSLKGASKEGFSKGLWRGASKSLEVPFKKDPHPSRFSSEAPWSFPSTETRRVLEAPFARDEKPPSRSLLREEEGELLVSREGGGASRRRLREGGLVISQSVGWSDGWFVSSFVR